MGAGFRGLHLKGMLKGMLLFAVSGNWPAQRGPSGSAKLQRSKHQNTDNTSAGYYTAVGLLIQNSEHWARSLSFPTSS